MQMLHSDSRGLCKRGAHFPHGVQIDTESAPTLPNFMMRMQETRLMFLVNLKTSQEEVVIEFEV